MKSPDESVEEGKYFCDICGNEMLDFNCELLCPNCGYRRDCTDP
jgi:rubrerythrin